MSPAYHPPAQKFDPTPAESRRFYSFHFPKLRNRGGKEIPVKCAFPWHKDDTASASVNLVKGTWFCHACNVGGGILDFQKTLTGKSEKECWDQINSIIGRNGNNHQPEPPRAASAPRIVGTYDYHNADGNVVHQTVRYEPKKFKQRRPDGNGGWIWNLEGVTPVLYDLPGVMRSNVIAITEGEKDKHSFDQAAASFPDDGGKLIYCGTTNAMGAGSWRDEYSPSLVGKIAVYVCEDNDDAGRRHAQQVCASASKYAPVYLVTFRDLCEHGDLSEYLKIHTPAELHAYMRAAPRWTPPADDVRHENESEHGDAWEPPEPDPKRGTGTATASGDWPEPEELDEELPAVPPFDLELLPESLRPLVKDTAERMGCVVDFPACAAVVALAAVTNRRVQIQPKEFDTGWVENGNLWSFVVGSPGTMKTPGTNPFLRIVREIEKGWMKEDEAKKQYFERAQKMDKVKLETWHEQSKKRLKDEDPNKPGYEDACKQIEENMPKPQAVEPLIRQLLTSDTTQEKLGITLSANVVGITQWRDEISGWIAMLERPGREGERQFFIECWSGNGYHRSDRVVRGSTVNDYLCLTMFGTIQPTLLPRLFSKEFSTGIDGDGLIPRFQLNVYPDILRRKRVDRAPDLDAIAKATKVYQDLATLNTEAPTLLRYNRDAQDSFNRWYDALLERLDSGELSPVMLAHLAKYPKLVATLSSLFAVAEGEREVVLLSHFERARKWAVFLEAHAVRLYAPRIDPAIASAIRLSKKIRKGLVGDEERRFTVRQVYQHHWTDLDDGDRVRAALEVLKGYGWVRKVDPKKVPNRPAEEWEVNPRVHIQGDAQ